MEMFHLLTLICVGGFIGILTLIVQVLVAGLIIGLTHLIDDDYVPWWRSTPGLWVITFISYLVIYPFIYFNYAGTHAIAAKTDFSVVVMAFIFSAHLSTMMMFNILRKESE